MEVREEHSTWCITKLYFFLCRQHILMHLWCIECVLNVGGLLGMGWSEELLFNRPGKTTVGLVNHVVRKFIFICAVNNH